MLRICLWGSSSLAVMLAITAVPANAAIVTFNGGNQSYFTNGVHTTSGTIDDGTSVVNFDLTTTISGMPDAGQVGSPSLDSRVRVGSAGADTQAIFNVDDNRANAGDWLTEWTFTFDQPLDNLRLTNISGVGDVLADLADWGVSWVGASGVATLTNGVPGLWSVGAPSAQLPDGAFTSGTQWRFDNNATPDDGNTVTDPVFGIELPDGVTELTVSFDAHTAMGDNAGGEGIRLDFTNAVVPAAVPEPSSMALLGLMGIGAVAGKVARRRKRKGADAECPSTP